MMIKYKQTSQSSEEDCTCLPACLFSSIISSARDDHLNNLNILSVLYH